MSEVDELLKRQAAWQANRRRLSWPEKVRMAEAVREQLAHLRRASSVSGAPGTTSGKGHSSRPGKLYRPQGRRRRGV